jgi:PRTRC genetic system protein E
MKTNFFATIAPFLGSMNLTLTVAKGSGDTVIVSLLPQPRIKDNAKESVQPMVIRGTIEELDEEFFNAIKEPMTKVTGIVIEIDNFEKGAEKLAEDNKAKDAIKAEAKKNKDKADKIVKKAEELFEAKDYDKAEKELAKAIALTPGTPAINKLSNSINDAKEALKPKDQVDIFSAIEEVKEQLPESPNELEIENNRIIQSNPMSEAEIEVLQDELDAKSNFQVESVNKFNYES